MIFTKFKEDRLIQEMQDNNIPVNKNYLYCSHKRGLIEDVTKRTVGGTLYSTLDASVMFLLVFCEDAIYVARCSEGALEFFKEKDNLTFDKQTMDSVKNLEVKDGFFSSVITWEYAGEKYAYKVDHTFPGIFKFNKTNYHYLKENYFKNINKRLI